MKRLTILALVAILSVALMRLPARTTAASVTPVSPSDASEIATSYDNLTTNFYKKVNAQRVLDGVRANLQAQLKKVGITSTLPSMHATTLPDANLHAIDREVGIADHLARTKVGSRDITYDAISGMLQSVHDRWTVFLDPKEYASLNSDLNGANFGGTGIVIQLDAKSKYISVENVIPNAPADKAGVEQGDLITAINGASTKGIGIAKAGDLLRGKQGTSVSITIQRDGKTLAPISITRATIHQVSVYDKMLPGKIGYVALTVFGKDTGSELAASLDQLRKQGARAIVMDLRDNGGGYLNAAVDVSSEFIPSGPIVSVESRASQITTLEADDTAIPPVPLAVLVNAYTASASEITSGAIQDSGVGTIIGVKTFGKGVVQTIYPLPDNSAVKITTARYLTPHNRDINHLGITPDIVVQEVKGNRYGDPTNDAQLQRAMLYLNDRLAHLDGNSGS